MYLAARLVRSLWVFWLIFASYLVQIGLAKVVRRWERDPQTGREEPVLPGWLERRRKRVDARNAKRLLRGILRLRGVYIKMGQVLSIMGGFLPRVYGREFESLQDQVPPQPFKAMRAAFVESMG
ncbi:MAG: AarF/ABC1/UbiB kinase family protein, partial [Polyangiales bacterium]